MDNNKKKVLIIIALILGIIAFLTILLSSMIKRDDIINIDDNNSISEEVISKDIEILSDGSKFFGIQKLINDFYLKFSNEETDDVLKVLDENYISSKGINESNLYNSMNTLLDMTSYVAQSIYYNPKSITTYYFVNGYLTTTSMFGDESNYYESVNYLIIVDETNNNYVIVPLDNNLNLQEYAKNYIIEKRTIDNGFKLTSITVSEENKLTIYINEFLNLLVYDNNRAYNMLQEETKKEYQNASDFKNQMLGIYSRFSSKIFSYSKKQDGNTIIYSIKDDKQNSIEITEYGLMNYKIAY